jgi:hypothetical protein
MEAVCDRLRTRPDESAEVVIRRNIVSAKKNHSEPDVDNIFTLAHLDLELGQRI